MLETKQIGIKFSSPEESSNAKLNLSGKNYQDLKELLKNIRVEISDFNPTSNYYTMTLTEINSFFKFIHDILVANSYHDANAKVLSNIVLNYNVIYMSIDKLDRIYSTDYQIDLLTIINISKFNNSIVDNLNEG